MSIRNGLFNTETEYGVLIKLFHLVVTLTFVLILITGYLSAEVLSGGVRVDVLYIHKSLGMLIMLVSIFWLFIVINDKVVHALGLKWWEKFLARNIQGLLFFSLLYMPFTGFFFANFATGDAQHVFNFFIINLHLPQNDAAKVVFRALHIYFAFFITGVVVLHISAAFKHYFIDRDKILQGMWYWWGGKGKRP